MSGRWASFQPEQARSSGNRGPADDTRCRLEQNSVSERLKRTLVKRPAPVDVGHEKLDVIEHHDPPQVWLKTTS